MSYEEFNQWMVDNNLTVFEKVRLEEIVTALGRLQPNVNPDRFSTARRLAIEAYRQIAVRSTEPLRRKN